MKRVCLLLAAFPLIVALSCASVPSGPVENLASSQAAVRAADELGAGRDPRAALHLKLAQEQLARAKQLIERGRVARAQLLLDRASADAELAIALTRWTLARAQAERAQRDMVAIRGR